MFIELAADEVEVPHNRQRPTHPTIHACVCMLGEGRTLPVALKCLSPFYVLEWPAITAIKSGHQHREWTRASSQRICPSPPHNQTQTPVLTGGMVLCCVSTGGLKLRNLLHHVRRQLVVLTFFFKECFNKCFVN